MDTLKNIDNNVVRIGRTQDEHIKNLDYKLTLIEEKQSILNANLEVLNQKLDIIITLLEKKAR